jgi:hypothetical protein
MPIGYANNLILTAIPVSTTWQQFRWQRNLANWSLPQMILLARLIGRFLNTI